jgi:Holliday junction resolvase RusA-like endonuclease
MNSVLEEFTPPIEEKPVPQRRVLFSNQNGYARKEEAPRVNNWRERIDAILSKKVRLAMPSLRISMTIFIRSIFLARNTTMSSLE